MLWTLQRDVILFYLYVCKTIIYTVFLTWHLHKTPHQYAVCRKIRKYLEICTLPVNNRGTGERSDIHASSRTSGRVRAKADRADHDTSSKVRRLVMQGEFSRSKNVAPRTRGWLKGVAAVVALGLGLAAQAAYADQAYPVVRFYNERTGTHFYTIDSAERDKVLNLYPWVDYE